MNEIINDFKYLKRLPGNQNYGPYRLDSCYIEDSGRNARLFKIEGNAGGAGRADFFTDYIEHSKQLATALLHWSDKIQFASCIYEYGRLERFQTTNPDVPYMDMMMEHMKVDYPELLAEYETINTKRNRLCDEIQKTMTNTIFIVPDIPSFQRFISDRIESLCPSLIPSDDQDLKTTNIYLVNRIFDRLFILISTGKSEIELHIEDSVLPGIKILLYQRTSVIAQGTLEDMTRLKQVVKGLIVNDEIIQRVNRYMELHKELINDSDIDSFKRGIRKLHEIIHGGLGRELGGIGACDICRKYGSHKSHSVTKISL